MADVDALIGKLRLGDYYSRSTAARALGEIGGEKATAALIEALNDEDDWVKEYAAEALGKLACEQAVGPLGELLNSSNYKVQSCAAEALGKIGGDEARKLLEPLKNDSDTWVREAVLGALRNISSEKPVAESETPLRAQESARGAEDEGEPELTMSEAPVGPERRPPSPARMLADRTPRTPEEIVELIAKGASIKYKATSSGFLLRVPVGGGRHQKVRLKFDSTDEEGSPIIQIFTVIAPAQPAHYRWALKLNPGFSYGAIGIVKIDGKEFLAITNTLLEENVDPKALEKSIRALAKRGDALEKKLIQKDSW
jgi:hypothetical protein